MRNARWKIRSKVFDFAGRGWIMGVLNVTPDSFSDGGEFFDTGKAIEHGRAMIEQGADIVDVGGESTRPGAEPVEIDQEKQRVLPVVKALVNHGGALISIDTSKAEVAAAAVEAGASIINDISGGRGDRAMFSVAAEHDVGFVVMHMQGTPRTMQVAPKYENVVSEVRDFFRQQYERAVQSGVDGMRLAFDPGIGFGKTPEHNLSLLRSLEALHFADRPLVVGVSRKAFLAKITGHKGTAEGRLFPTVGFTSLLRFEGADVVRVHDVRPNLEALRVADALSGSA